MAPNGSTDSPLLIKIFDARDSLMHPFENHSYHAVAMSGLTVLIFKTFFNMVSDVTWKLNLIYIYIYMCVCIR